MPYSHGISNPGILKFYNDNVTGAIRPFCFSGLLILVRVSHKNPYESKINLTFVRKTSSYKYKSKVQREHGMIADGTSLTNIAKRYGIHRNTLSNYLKEIEPDRRRTK